jgi:hypothetical protein
VSRRMSICSPVATLVALALTASATFMVLAPPAGALAPPGPRLTGTIHWTYTFHGSTVPDACGNYSNHTVTMAGDLEVSLARQTVHDVYDPSTGGYLDGTTWLDDGTSTVTAQAHSTSEQHENLCDNPALAVNCSTTSDVDIEPVRWEDFAGPPIPDHFPKPTLRIAADIGYYPIRDWSTTAFLQADPSGVSLGGPYFTSSATGSDCNAPQGGAWLPPGGAGNTPSNGTVALSHRPTPAPQDLRPSSANRAAERVDMVPFVARRVDVGPDGRVAQEDFLSRDGLNAQCNSANTPTR